VTVNFLDDEPSWKHFESLQAEAPTGSKLHGVTGDIGKKPTSEAIVQEAVDKHGSLDIYVANAGVSQFKDFVTCVYALRSSKMYHCVTKSNLFAGLMRTRSTLTSTPT
jgi:NADP-dependent 3-hydroxy acid dehydrogenase YdfG